MLSHAPSCQCWCPGRARFSPSTSIGSPTRSYTTAAPWALDECPVKQAVQVASATLQFWGRVCLVDLFKFCVPNPSPQWGSAHRKDLIDISRMETKCGQSRFLFQWHHLYYRKKITMNASVCSFLQFTKLFSNLCLFRSLHHPLCVLFFLLKQGGIKARTI